MDRKRSLCLRYDRFRLFCNSVDSVQFWASMFGIKIEEDAYPLQWTTAVD